MFGEEREYLTIKILHNDMTVMVPCENAGKAGLRRVIDEETVKKVLAVLADDVSEMPKNWNRRFKHNRDKIKTGDIYELAEVVRNLAIREHEKGLSTGEKQMFTRAKKILASELMYALEKDEDEAEEHLDNLLLRLRERARRSRAPRGYAERRAPREQSQRSRSSWPPVVANALGPIGPRRSSRWRGRPMLEWSLDALRARGRSSEIVVALPRGRATRRRPAPRRRRRARRARTRCATRSRGRPTRDAVVVHDAARPLLTPSSFAPASPALGGADAAIAAAPVTDTIKEARRRAGRQRDARPLAAVGGPDAAGLPPRGPGARARRRPTRCSPPRPTTRRSSRRRRPRAARPIARRELQGHDAARPARGRAAARAAADRCAPC